MPLTNVYVHKGRIYLPVVAKTDAGFYLNVEPVTSMDSRDTNSLAKAIEDAIRFGNPRIPTPRRDEFKKGFVIPLPGVRSWAAFERQSISFMLYPRNNEYHLEETVRGDSGRWESDRSLLQLFPLDCSPEEIAKYIIDRIAQRDDMP